MPPLVCNINTEMLPAENNEINFVALHYLPCDAPHSFAPIKIIGDGNYFPRTLSYFLFKDQEHYQEMHTCIVYEACVNKSRYLDNNYIKIGANHEYNRSTKVQQFAQYADNYVPGQPLNVEQIYKSEVLDMARTMPTWEYGNFFKLPM